MLERWAELMGCSTYASERLGHNCGVQRIHLKPHSNINMAYQRLRFTFSHSLLVQATCPLYRYVLGYTFARRPLYSSGALWCNVSGNMFSSLQHDLFSGYIRAFLIANVAFSLFCQRRSMKIHRLPTSLIISSHRTHHTHNWYGFKWYVATKSHGQIFLSTFNMQTSGRIVFMQKHFWK